MNMSYSAITHALINYVEGHLENMNLGEMAKSFGFSNPESFTRAFRKIFGMTPSRFRSERPLIGRKQLGEVYMEWSSLTEKQEGMMEL
jgi:AraC family transcriptional regulator